MWSPILLAIIVAILMALTFGCDQRDESGRTSDYRTPGQEQTITKSGDHGFMATAARANLAEVELGRLADSRGTDAEVKKFAQHMIDDHSQANSKLKDLAQKKGVQLPTTPDDAQKEEASRLSALSGAEFDKKYAAMMVKDHEKAVALFQEESKGARDADVRDFAEKTLPTLQHHLKMARDLSEKVGTPTAD
jgi:putative membrane protein